MGKSLVWKTMDHTHPLIHTAPKIYQRLSNGAFLGTLHLSLNRPVAWPSKLKRENSTDAGSWIPHSLVKGHCNYLGIAWNCPRVSNFDVFSSCIPSQKTGERGFGVVGTPRPVLLLKFVEINRITNNSDRLVCSLFATCSYICTHRRY